VLSLSAGIFPFKYNPDVRNLGEYLFRGPVSPGFLITAFDFQYATLSGFNLNSSIPIRKKRDKPKSTINNRNRHLSIS